MGFLQRFLTYKKICIQCHNNPDADTIASAFGIYRYLTAHNIEAAIVYGGLQKIKKLCLKMMLDKCHIPIQYVHSISDSNFDLLFLVDCQYGQGNAEKFESDEIAIIDHHIQMVDVHENYLIKSSYQSCSTLIWELLREEGYDVKEDQELSVALLYGLYTDTSCYADLYSPVDTNMRTELFADQPLFERLAKASMSIAELMIVSDAMFHHYFDVERHFTIVEALTCDQTVLGIIGDFMIQVDVVFLSFTCTEANNGYQISLRTCHENLPANKIAAYLCEGIGNGGGHAKKAGGRILKEKMQEKYGEKSIFDVINQLLCQYIDEHLVYDS